MFDLPYEIRSGLAVTSVLVVAESDVVGERRISEEDAQRSRALFYAVRPAEHVRIFGPVAVTPGMLQKRLIRAWEDLPMAEAIRAGIDTFMQSWHGEEPRRMLRAFLDRPRPAKR